MTEMNWQLVRVHGLDELVEAMERAEDKGYLPDAIKDAWDDFALDAASPAAPSHPTDAAAPAKSSLRYHPDERVSMKASEYEALVAAAAPAQSAEPVAQQRVAYRCPDCAGAGVYAKASVLPEPPDVTCMHCNGRGTLYATPLKSEGLRKDAEPGNQTLTDAELTALVRKVEDKLGIVWFVPDDSDTYLWRTTNTNERDRFARALEQAIKEAK